MALRKEERARNGETYREEVLHCELLLLHAVAVVARDSNSDEITEAHVHSTEKRMERKVSNHLQLKKEMQCEMSGVADSALPVGLIGLFRAKVKAIGLQLRKRATTDRNVRLRFRGG